MIGITHKHTPVVFEKIGTAKMLFRFRRKIEQMIAFGNVILLCKITGGTQGPALQRIL